MNDDADQGEGATPAAITNHAFEPEDAWWTVCRVCGLAEAAHETTTLPASATLGGDDA